MATDCTALYTESCTVALVLTHLLSSGLATDHRSPWPMTSSPGLAAVISRGIRVSKEVEGREEGGRRERRERRRRGGREEGGRRREEERREKRERGSRSANETES